MIRQNKPLLLAMIVLVLLSVKSYGQDTPKEVLSLPNDKPAVTFEDAAKLTLDRLDAAEEYIKKLEQEGAALEDRLQLEKERVKLLTALTQVKDAEIAALKREREASIKIDSEKDTIIKAQQDRISKLEQKKGGGFIKGFGIGFVAGFVAKVLL